MTVVLGKCRSPSLVGLCQHLPSAVSQQYLHVPGVLPREGLYHLTECSVGACVHVGDESNNVDVSPPKS